MSNVKVGSQYIKNLSFEVPCAPDIFLMPNTKPDISLSIDIDAKKLSVNSYEVSLKIKAEARGDMQGDNKVIFICKIEYAGIFIIDENIIDQGEIEQILLIYCPNILFPFIRKIIANCTVDGGFSPLMIDPINFSDLYQRRSEDK